MKNILFLLTLIVSPVFAQEEGAKNCGANDFALQILGSGGPFGNGRASAGYLLWIDGQSRIMIDAGGGTFAHFGEAGANIADLQLLAISHLPSRSLRGITSATVASERPIDGCWALGRQSVPLYRGVH